MPGDVVSPGGAERDPQPERGRRDALRCPRGGREGPNAAPALQILSVRPGSVKHTGLTHLVTRQPAGVPASLRVQLQLIQEGCF